MAQWIKSDGIMLEVKPKGVEFQLDEIKAFIDNGWLDALMLTPTLHMYFDDMYVVKSLPVNHKATELLHKHRPDLSHVTIQGNVLVATTRETGDE